MQAQGAVGSVREFAAAQASSEEKRRTNRQMNEVLRMDKLEDAQRRMAEIAREKVRNAVKQRRDQELLMEDKPLTQGDEEPDDLGNLNAEIRLYKRAGLSSAVVQMQSALQRSLDERKIEREAKFQKLLRQRTVGMEMRHQGRFSRMQSMQETDMQALTKAQADEFSALVLSQAEEAHELTETVTGMIALEAGWVPHEKANKPWIAQLKKLRFRPSWHLSEMQTHLDKLGDGGSAALNGRTADLQKQVDSELKQETEEWHDKLMQAALGEHGSSIISQLVSSHKISQAKMVDHHAQKMRLAEKQATAAMKMLQGQFRLEKIQLIEKIKQQQRKAEEEEALASSSIYRPRSIFEGARSRSHNHNFEENSTARGLDDTGKLLLIFWLNPERDVLRSLLRVDNSRNLFTRFVEGNNKRDVIGLKLLEQVQQCKLLQDEEARFKLAMKLHDAHWAVSTDAKMAPVNGETALELLEQRAETILERLQATWLPNFLEEHGERMVHLVIDEKPQEFASVPRIRGQTWLELLSAATEELPNAVIVADMAEPGAWLVSVNRAFELLTGYEREEEDQSYAGEEQEKPDGWQSKDPIGRNCRFLQGPETQQDAVQELVSAIRSARTTQVELTNYREDGSTFCNLVSLRPVHDSAGRYRFCIAVLADASSLNEASRAQIDRLQRMLPDCFDASLQPMPYSEPKAEDAVTDNHVQSIEAVKLTWLQNLNRSFRALLQYPDAVDTLQDAIIEDQPEMHQHLALILAVRRCSLLPRDAQLEASRDIARAHLEPIVLQTASTEKLPRLLQASAGMAIGKLATHYLPKFLRSPKSDAAVAQVQLGREQTLAGGTHLLWDGYTAPADASDWLSSIASSVEKMKVGVCISDARMGGNPLIYVNRAFCEMTGYSKSEVLGRNCRFLQGSSTEVRAISAMVDALRHGADISLMLTNYRRSGETFQNLLSLRPVHDSNGVYRFVISVSTDANDQGAALELHAALVQLLPCHLKLSQYAEFSGPYHELREKREAKVDIDGELRVAKSGMPPTRTAHDVTGMERFASHHSEMVASIAAAPDRISLTAVLWLCPSVAKMLIAALAHVGIASILAPMIPRIESDLGVKLTGMLPLDVAKTLVRKYLERFLEGHGKELIHLVESQSKSTDESLNLDEVKLPALPTGTDIAWLDLLDNAIDDVPFAMVAADMFEPGARLVSVNRAFVELTGYEREEALGRNCRFLQGAETEQDAVTQLVEALRNAHTTQVELTNYRKDGSSFRNLISLRPVHDSQGRYRFCIGVLSDAGTLTPSVLEKRASLCRMLPRRFESSMQTMHWARRSSSAAQTDANADDELFRAHETRSLRLTKLLWLGDPEASIRIIMDNPEALHTFRQYLDHWKTAPAERGARLLSLILGIRHMVGIADEMPKIQVAVNLAAQYLDDGDAGSTSPEQLPNELIQREQEFMQMLANTCLPSFIRSALSDGPVSQLKLGSEQAYGGSSHLLWDQYNAETDALGWLFSVISTVETMNVPVCISDVRIAGNPLVYANQAFCNMTGYSKSEIHGRNCRFLQGPETEVESVSAIVSALRHGADCTVKITNYRRSGETFDNLLAMRAVHDSNGVFRYCVSASGETSNRRVQLELLHSFVELFPAHLTTADRILKGPKHAEDRDTPHSPVQGLSVSGMIADALVARGSVKQFRATDLTAPVRFSKNHTNALQSLGVYDLVRPFTRMMWLAEPLEVFQSLTPFRCFRDIFSMHVEALDMPKLSAMWRPVKQIKELANMTAAQVDVVARQLYTDNIGKLSRGQSVQSILKALEEHATTSGTKIVDTGSFISFIESSRCLQLLEELSIVDTGTDQIITAANDTWLEMLSATAEKLSFALIAADMSQPGAKLVCVNQAFEDLTGYSREEALGRNCRFLQGPGSEPDKIQEIIQSLRAARPAQIELTNYRKDGTAFRNHLSLRPVFDSSARYCYSIGVLADVASLTPTILDELRGLCRLLPRRYESAPSLAIPEQKMNRAVTTSAIAPMSEDARRSIARTFCLVDCGDSLSVLARDEQAMELFAQHLGTRRNLLDFWVQATEVDIICDDRERNQVACDLITRFLDPTSASLALATDAATHVAEEACIAFDLLTDLLPGFLVSKHAAYALDALLKLDQRLSQIIDSASQLARSLFWSQYRIAADLGWQMAFAAVANELPLSISISDFTSPGNPLVYLNNHFTHVTGYTPADALGRNCRFLQGPETPFHAIQELKEQLRKTSDSFVRLSNYRRNGEAFDSVLATRCIRDNHGKVRFCVGISLLLDDRILLTDELKLLAKIFASVPRCINEAVDNDDAEALPQILEKLNAAIARKYEPVVASNMKPLIPIDPPVGALRSITRLTRIYWASLSPNQVVAFLSIAGLRKSLLWYVHAHSPAAEETLSAFIREHNLDGERDLNSADLTPPPGSDDYLSELQHTYIRPYVMQDTRLGEKTPAVQGVNLLHLPADEGWLAMFAIATENLSFAVIAADMYEPGAKLVSVNNAFEKLTGHSRADVVGHNCRFLQGTETSADAMVEIVHALQTAQQARVKLVNYRKDGSSFTNVLSLYPVHDTDGVYRFSIGVLANADELDAQKFEAMEKLCEVLPVTFDQSLQPLNLLPTFDKTALLPQAFNGASFSRLDRAKLELCAKIEQTVQDVVSRPESLSKFRKHLETLDRPTSPKEASFVDEPLPALIFYLEAVAFHALTPVEQREQLHHTFGKYGKKFSGEGKSSFMAARDAAMAVISAKEQALIKLSEFVPGFLSTALADDHAATIDLGSDLSVASSMHLVWPAYQVPDDVAGWLFSIISAVDHMDVGVCISDMRVAGCPLVYANQGFCKISGYSSKEILGNNCRFMQGPETEVEAVSAIVDTIRRGSDCTLKMVNYRRNHERFENLLSLRSVHDSNGVYRFIICVQCETSASPVVVELHTALLRLLPVRIEVGDISACGPVHHYDIDDKIGSQRTSESSGAGQGSRTTHQRTRELFDDALRGRMPVNRAADICDPVRFRNNHQSFHEKGLLSDDCSVMGSDRRGSDGLEHEDAESEVGSQAMTEHTALSRGEHPNSLYTGSHVGSDHGTSTSALEGHATARISSDASMVYTKLMWLRKRSTEFVKTLLSFPLAEEAWMKSMIARQQPTSRLSFCCRAAQLENLDEERRRVGIFQLAKKYLGLRDQLRVEEVARMVNKHLHDLLSELSQVEFGCFLASQQCNELIYQMRELSPPPGGAMHLVTPPDILTSGTANSAEVLVQTISAALNDFPAAILISDRSVGGFPIVCISSGVVRLTGYSASDMLGWNCRLLQGPKTEVDAVKEMVNSLRDDRATEVTLTNYHKNGSAFTNLLSVGTTLRIIPGTELVASVLRMPPPPLQAARSDVEAAEVLNLFASCSSSVPRQVSSNHGTVNVEVAHLLDSTPFQGGLAWLIDAEATLNRMLRVPPVRAIFARTITMLASQDVKHMSWESNTATDQDHSSMVQEIQLMMHSDNVLHDRDHYLKSTCALWSELADLNRIHGWEWRASLAALNKKHIKPDRGNRRHTVLWRCLRAAVYDPIVEAERNLLDPNDTDQPTIDDLRDTMKHQEQRLRPLRLGSKGTAAEAIAMLRSKRRSSVGVNFIGVDSPKRLRDSKEDQASDKDFADGEEEELPPDELLEMENLLASEEAKMEQEGRDTDPLMSLRDGGAPRLRSRRASLASRGDNDSDEAGSEGAGTGSQSSSQSASGESLSDVAMLQHILLRVMCINALPSFLKSVGYRECADEVHSCIESNPMYALLDVELESLRISQPASTEAWAGLLSASMRYLPHAVILCDLSLPGVPIVAVNAAFELLTGYDASECMGKSCRFLQGEKTDAAAVAAISEAIRHHRGCHVSLVNHRKDGSSFLNLLSLKPIFDQEGLGRFMLGCLVEVHDSYIATKPQLRHVDRMLKLIDSRLPLPSSPDARQRMLEITRTTLREPPRAHGHAHTAEEIGEKSRLTSKASSTGEDGSVKSEGKVDTGSHAAKPIQKRQLVRRDSTGVHADPSSTQDARAKTRAASSTLTDALADGAAGKLTRPATGHKARTVDSSLRRRTRASAESAGSTSLPNSPRPNLGLPGRKTPASAMPKAPNSSKLSSKTSTLPGLSPTPPTRPPPQRPASARQKRHSNGDASADELRSFTNADSSDKPTDTGISAWDDDEDRTQGVEHVRKDQEIRNKSPSSSKPRASPSPSQQEGAARMPARFQMSSQTGSSKAFSEHSPKPRRRTPEMKRAASPEMTTTPAKPTAEDEANRVHGVIQYTAADMGPSLGPPGAELDAFQAPPTEWMFQPLELFHAHDLEGQ